jgi:hypothetical protein
MTRFALAWLLLISLASLTIAQDKPAAEKKTGHARQGSALQAVRENA